MPQTYEEVQAYRRKYYQEHREEFLARAAAYEAANREKRREYRRIYYQTVTRPKKALRRLQVAQGVTAHAQRPRKSPTAQRPKVVDEVKEAVQLDQQTDEQQVLQGFRHPIVMPQDPVTIDWT